MTDSDAPKPYSPPTCPYCSMSLTAHQQYHPGHCGSPPCQVAHVEAGQRKLSDARNQDYADRQTAVRAQSTDALASAAAHLDCETTELKIAVVPYQSEPLAALSETELTTFQTHLERAAAAAFALDDPTEILANYRQKRTPEPEIVDAGCTACQGHCCKRGGGDNHAFIDRQSICSIREIKPDLTEQAVINHFLDALPDQSVVGACVFQSNKGCTLTRDWRAGLCNTFLCHDIFAMHDLTGGRLDVPLVVAGINDDKAGSTGLYQHDKPFTPL